MVEKLDKRNFIIIFLIISVIIMAIGYMNLSSVLGLESKKENNIQNKTWNISITGIKKMDSNGKVKELLNPSHTNSTATFDVQFFDVGDSITYKIKISNKGSIDARLKNIIIMPELTTSDNINYRTNNLYVGSVIKSGKSTYLLVKVSYDKKIGEYNLTKHETIILDYAQK